MISSRPIPHPTHLLPFSYAIASKATLLKPQDMPVPADKFEAAFGLPWKKALEDNVVYNALDACEVLGVDAAGLDALWASAKKVKFGGGFYCGLLTVPGKKPIYVFNGAWGSSGFLLVCVPLSLLHTYAHIHPHTTRLLHGNALQVRHAWHLHPLLRRGV